MSKFDKIRNIDAYLKAKLNGTQEEVSED